MGNDRYTVIIVGAGVGGIACALHCAQNNISVALIERGENAGSKNMFGGTIYRAATAQIIPAFWEKDAPLERTIINDTLWFLEQKSAFKVGFTGLNYNQPPYNKFTVIRSRFDKWFAEQAVKAGAHLMTSTLVTDLIYEKKGVLDKKVVGVILEDGKKIYADIVVLAEGGQAKLTRKYNLQKNKLGLEDMTLYVKEILALPENIIEARFNLEKDEGAIIGMLGFPTAGASGKGGLWTNKDTISIIVGTYLNQFVDHKLNPYQLLSRLKKHPLVQRMIAGSETVQYQAKIIPKGGYKKLPSLVDNGLLVIGDAAMLVYGRHGTDLAMLSGKYAAETITQAQAKNDFTKELLNAYIIKLNNSFIIKNIKNHKKAREYYQKFPDSDYLISKTINDIFYEYFTTNLETEKEKLKKMLAKIKELQSMKKNVKDIFYGLRFWEVL